jgi:hypothetical protein
MFSGRQHSPTSRRRTASSRLGSRILAAGASVALVAGLALAVSGPSSALPDAGPDAGSGAAPVVWTGSMLATTSVTSNGDDLLYWWQADGTSMWHKEIVAQNNVAKSGTSERFFTPSITWTGSDVVIVADVDSNFEGMGGYSLDTYWQQPGGTTWTQEFSGLGGNSGIDGDASGAQPFVRPQIAWTGSNVVIADVGAVGTRTAGRLPDNVYFWWQDSSGNFHQEKVASHSSTASYGQAVLTATDDAVVIVAIRNGTDLLSWYQSFGRTGWTANGIAGGFSDDAFSAPSVAWTGSSVVVAATVVGDNPSVKYEWQPSPGTAWQGQFLPAPPGSPVPTWTGSTAIAWTGSNVDITAVDSHNNALDFWWLSPGTRTWNPEIVSEPAGITLGRQPSMTTTTDAAFIVLNQSNGLIRWAQDYGTVPWRPQTISP